MSEVLDQNEIDALLASITPQPGGAATAKRDVGEELRGAVATPNNSNDEEFDVDVTGYDFKRPKRVSKDQIRALGGIHDDFARSFGASLSGFLRTIVDVHVVAVEQVMYSEFIHSLPNPTCFVILQANPLEGQMFLEFSPLIVYPIIDRLLGGGGGDTLIPQRPLTSIEWRLMGRLIDRAVEHLGDAWRNLADAKFEVMETESNPHLVNIVAPTEVVVFITYEIKMGNAAATMSMCIPFNAIESVLGKLAQQSWLGYRPKAASELQQRCLLRNLRRSSVGITAYLGQARIRLSELRGLQVGDLIELDKSTEMQLLMQVEGRTKFAGTAGSYRGRRAIRVTRSAAIDEPI